MVELRNLGKTFFSPQKSVVLKNINLTIEDGDIFGIIGESGAGKSTLARCINFLEPPTEGSILFDGVDLGKLNRKELLEKRRSMSMIFQSFNLFAQRTALKNICYPLEIAGVKRAEAEKKALELLTLVGLDYKAKSYPSQMSGGQKQRVAIARALATDPKLLICDEATSSLDPNTTNSILNLLTEINKKLGVTILVITHEMGIIEQYCNKVAVLDRPNLVETGYVKDVLFSPTAEATKKLILNINDNLAFNLTDRDIAITFNGEDENQSVISDIILKCNCPVNIIASNTKTIDNKIYGQIAVRLPDNENSKDTVKKYLTDCGIAFKEAE